MKNKLMSGILFTSLLTTSLLAEQNIILYGLHNISKAERESLIDNLNNAIKDGDPTKISQAERGIIVDTEPTEPEPTEPEPEKKIVLASNGVTITCPTATTGSTITENGVDYYIAIDKLDIKNKISDGFVANNICTTHVNDMYRMFRNTTFNQDISSWDVSNVTNMIHMFDMSSFNQDISNWDVSNVNSMGVMFARSPFNQDISGWNVSNVNNMAGMFENASFNQDISNWDTSNVAFMGSMFKMSPFNQDISNWDVSNVINMWSMFDGNNSFNQDLSSWNVSSVTVYNYYDRNTSNWTLPKPTF